MALQRPQRRITHLWQLPLLLVSLGLFGYAAYLFIDPKPGLSVAQKIELARTYIQQVRSEAAVQELNGLLSHDKLDKTQEATVHALLAEAIDVHQHEKHISVPIYNQRIIEQTKLAEEGIKPTPDMLRRLGEAYEALHLNAEALATYRQLITLDKDHALRIQRRIIDIQLASDDPGTASPSLDSYLQAPDLTESERAWALGETAHLMIDRGNIGDARRQLNQAVALASDDVARGQINYWLGYCAWKLAQPAEAERLLLEARQQLHVSHPLDGDAAYLLGRIAQDRNSPAEAIADYEVVLQSHPESRSAPLAKLGRGICRIMEGHDDAGLNDLHDLVNEIDQKGARAAKYKDETIAGLQQAGRILSARGNWAGALELMAHEQALQPDAPASFFARLASVYSHRADQVEAELNDPKTTLATAERVRLDQQMRSLRSHAGDALIAYSRALTVVDDKGYGDALWRGIDLYDRAGDLPRAIAALEVFVAERPDDALTPEALLRLGQAYQVAGLYDKAIAAFERNQFRFPQSLAASRSAVPLAQAYIAKGPEWFAKAEIVLLRALDNPALTPEANEFRQALLELAQLYYRTNRFEEAVVRLEEFTKRYPDEPRMGQILFLMADSYRKSANLIDLGTGPSATQPSTTQPTVMQAAAHFNGSQAGIGAEQIATTIDPIEAMAARKERLNKARALYDKVIDLYHTHPPADDAGKLYQKLAHYYTADCVYDLGNYEEAIRLYDAAAFRYQDDPSSLAAYVQIVNAYCALGKFDEARTANERAKWLLKRMPPEAFTNGSFTMPQKYWEEWLQWTSKSTNWGIDVANNGNPSKHNQANRDR